MTILTRPEGNLPGDLNLSRRAVASVFFAGYAAAAVSADAAPITTDTTGLITETVMLPTAGQSLPAYVARPAARGRHGVVLVVSEIFGVHEYIKDVCRRFAKLGYAAIAPAFFVRAGDPAPLTDFAEIRRIVGQASDAQVMGDVRDTLKFLKAQAWARMSRVGVTGFCWGGGVTWLACENFTEFKAGAAWYGRLAPAPGAAAVPGQMWPIQMVSQLHAPVLGLYAGKDQLTTAVPAMREALIAAGKTGSEIIIYPEANHGFHADYRPTYDEAAAKDGWARLLAHFRKNGVTP